jgi:hypothetical protein
MRNHRLATLVAAAAMATASALAAVPPAHAETTTVEFLNAYNGECLQPAFGSSPLGEHVAEVPCNGSLAQQWTITPSASGVHLVNRSSGLCMDARGGAVDGTPVEQWTCDWISNENWSFGTGYELASGVSGTFKHCVATFGVWPVLDAYLQPCTGGLGEIWYRTFF